MAKKDEFKEAGHLMRKEREAKEKVKSDRERLLQRYKVKLKELMDDEDDAVDEYELMADIADTLGFKVDADYLRKILADEERHKVIVATILSSRSGK